MATVEVEVDIDEFETYELVSEIVRRISKRNRKGISDEQKKELKTALENEKEENVIEIKTLEDKMKMEHLENVWRKYSLADLQNLLP